MANLTISYLASMLWTLLSGQGQFENSSKAQKKVDYTLRLWLILRRLCLGRMIVKYQAGLRSWEVVSIPRRFRHPCDDSFLIG